MFVEEGFRIRFGNGEVIDFYADSAADKDGWLRVLSDTVGKGSSSGGGAIKPWADLVLKRERAMKTRRQTSNRLPADLRRLSIDRAPSWKPPQLRRDLGRRRLSPHGHDTSTPTPSPRWAALKRGVRRPAR